MTHAFPNQLHHQELFWGQIEEAEAVFMWHKAQLSIPEVTRECLMNVKAGGLAGVYSFSHMVILEGSLWNICHAASAQYHDMARNLNQLIYVLHMCHVISAKKQFFILTDGNFVISIQLMTFSLCIPVRHVQALPWDKPSYVLHINLCFYLP